MGEKFDASRYLTRLDGREYLEVRWRLLWLRTENPEAVIETELVKHDGGMALFRARVVLPNGGEATGWGSETVNDFGDYIEKAETKALGRACAALGYGTQFCGDFDFIGEGVVDSPLRGRQTTSTPSQIKAIYAIAREEHGLSEDEADQRSLEGYGRSPEELTKREASEFINRLKGKGG